MLAPRVDSSIFLCGSTPVARRLGDRLKESKTLVLPYNHRRTRQLLTFIPEWIAGAYHTHSASTRLFSVGTGGMMSQVLLPNKSTRYTTCLLIGQQISCYPDGGNFYGSSDVGYTHRSLGTLRALGPFIIASRAPAFLTREDMADTNIVARWNKTLETAFNHKSSSMVGRFLQGMIKTNRPSLHMKAHALEDIDYAKRIVAESRVALGQARQSLSEVRTKFSVWKGARYACRKTALNRAVEEGIIEGYYMFTSEVTLLHFPARKMMLPAVWSRRNGEGYPGGLYRFPAMHLTVLDKGSVCYMRDPAGNIYRHPHAGLGGDGRPCWDEMPPFNGAFDPLDNYRNNEKADFLWYTSPRDYCLFIKGYLNSVWNYENGGNEYQPLQEYGSLEGKETEPTPTGRGDEGQGERQHNYIPIVHDYIPDISLWPVNCGHIHESSDLCICSCGDCSLSRNIRRNSTPEAFDTWQTTQDARSTT